MKQLFIFTATILACMGMRAQETGIDSVLRQIEANNKELQANAQLISSQKLESRTENNLPDPTLSYAHLWDSKNSDETVGEMVVSQSFDFPTLYITRGKMNRLKTGALDAQAATMRHAAGRKKARTDSPVGYGAQVEHGSRVGGKSYNQHLA